MICGSFRLLLISFILIILLYDRAESKRSGGRSSSSRGSSGSRSSSRGSSSSSSRGSSSGSSSSGWFGSSANSGSSSSSSWGSGSSSSSRSSSGGGSRSYGTPNYDQSRRGWSNRYHGNNFVVMRTHTYYRGGGSYGSIYSSSSGQGTSKPVAPQQSTDSEKPTVTTEKIKNVLFPGDPRIPTKEIFSYDDNAFRMKYDQYGLHINYFDQIQDILSSPRDWNTDEWMKDRAKMRKIMYGEIDESAVIIDEKLPVIVGSIPYFWGENNLPQSDNETDCIDFSAANDPSNFTICNVTSLIKCEKSLDSVILVRENRKYSYSKKENAKIIVKNGNGSIVDKFAWFCPTSDNCCEWECCSTEDKEHTEWNPPDEMFVSSVHLLIGLAFFFLVICVCCGCCKYVTWVEERTRNQQRSRSQQQQQSVEMEPLTADYPRQSRNESQTEGNYGWSVQPTAPPCD